MTSRYLVYLHIKVPHFKLDTPFQAVSGHNTFHRFVRAEFIKNSVWILRSRSRMSFLPRFAVILIWINICLGAQVPRRIRRQDSSKAITHCGDIIDHVNQGKMLLVQPYWLYES